MRLVLGVLLFSLSASVIAGGYKPQNPSQYCFYAIYETLESLDFKGSSSTTSSSSSSANSTSSHASGTNNGSWSGKKEVELAARGGYKKHTSATECTDQIMVESIYASMVLYCSPLKMRKGIAFWKALCENSDAALMDLTSIEANITEAAAGNLTVIDPSTYTGTVISPVVLLKSEYRRYYRALVRQCCFIWAYLEM